MSDSKETTCHKERPHQALGGTYPGDVYTPSAHTYKPPDEPEYPYHDKVIRVTRCGRIGHGQRKINLSVVFAGQMVGIREVDDQSWLVSFMDYDLGFFDNEQDGVEPGPNPFAPGQSVNEVSGIRCKPGDRNTPWWPGADRFAI